jgi:hypothetical protein
VPGLSLSEGWTCRSSPPDDADDQNWYFTVAYACVPGLNKSAMP